MKLFESLFPKPEPTPEELRDKRVGELEAERVRLKAHIKTLADNRITFGRAVENNNREDALEIDLAEVEQELQQLSGQ